MRDANAMTDDAKTRRLARTNMFQHGSSSAGSKIWNERVETGEDWRRGGGEATGNARRSPAQRLFPPTF